MKLVAVGSGLILVGLLPALYMAYRRRKGVALNESGNEGSRPRSGSEPGQIVVPDDGPAQDAPEPFSTSNPLPPAAKTWFIAVFAGITVLLLATAVACLVVGNPNGAELAAFFAILTALMLSLCVLARVRPPRVEVSDTGIVVVDPFRTRRIRWHDLRRVEYVDVKRDSGPTTRLCFFKTSGRRVLVDESAAPPYSDRGVFRDRVLAYRDYMLRKENGGPGRADPPRPDE